MKAMVFLIVLSSVLLPATLLADDAAGLARAEAARRLQIQGAQSNGSKADTPSLMSYQGTLTDAAGIALDTTVSVTFTIYDAEIGGVSRWTETQPLVEVNDGLFNVLLGEVNPLTASVFSGADRWLGVQVNGDPELVPRQRIGAVAYAFQSGGDGDWLIVGDDLYSNVADQVNIISSTKAAEGTVGRRSSRAEESGISEEKGTRALYVEVRRTWPWGTMRSSGGESMIPPAPTSAPSVEAMRTEPRVLTALSGEGFSVWPIQTAPLSAGAGSIPLKAVSAPSGAAMGTSSRNMAAPSASAAEIGFDLPMRELPRGITIIVVFRARTRPPLSAAVISTWPMPSMLSSAGDCITGQMGRTPAFQEEEGIR
jgi:hypothetical protein